MKIKMQSEHSGYRPDRNSYVYFETGNCLLFQLSAGFFFKIQNELKALRSD